MTTFGAIVDQQSLPPIEDYPGYFADKPPFLRRKRVQVAAAGIVGIVMGAMLGGSGTEASTTSRITESQVQHRISVAVRKAVESEQAAAESRQAAVESDKTAAESRFTGAVAELDDAKIDVKRLEGQLADARVDMRRVKHTARAAQRRAVADAVARTKGQMEEQAASSEPQGFSASGGGGGTDPRFNYCYEANAAGYGDYQRGVDPEYDWYDDADNDGSVCET